MTPILLGNAKYEEVDKAIKDNELSIRKLLPDTWTHLANLNPLSIGFQLKVMGFDWRTEREYSAFMGHLQKVGILQLNGMQVRRSSHPLFQKETPNEERPAIQLGYQPDSVLPTGSSQDQDSSR